LEKHEGNTRTDRNSQRNKNDRFNISLLSKYGAGGADVRDPPIGYCFGCPKPPRLVNPPRMSNGIYTHIYIYAHIRKQQ